MQTVYRREVATHCSVGWRRQRWKISAHIQPRPGPWEHLSTTQEATVRHLNGAAELAILATGVLMLCGQPARAQCQAPELTRLAVPRPATADLYGAAVSVADDVGIVGVWTDNEHGNSTGAAHIFRRNGSAWVHEQALRIDDATVFDYFGVALAIAGDVAVVGAPGEDDRTTDGGAVYIYRHAGSSWVLDAELFPNDLQVEERFGNAVALSGDTLLVGAWTDNGLGLASGSAYVFRHVGMQWVQEAKLLASDGAAGDWFGRSVALSGDTAVIGAPNDDDLGVNAGSVYVFQRSGSTWAQEAKLYGDDTFAGDQLGTAVAVAGDVLVAGAPYFSTAGPASGAAYVFRRSGTSWAVEQKLLPVSGAVLDYFGYSVAMADDTAVIGAPLDGQLGFNSGTAYVFRHRGGTWTEEARLLASNGRAYNYLGISAALSGDTVILGSADTDAAADTSSVGYVFGGVSDCNGNGVLDLCDVATGTSHDTNGNGIPDECEAHPGDLNCDGVVDFGDINPFVIALTGYDAYRAAFPACRWLNADCNGDDAVNFADINPFVALLSGT